MRTIVDEQDVATMRHDDPSTGLKETTPDTGDAWLRHYETAARRRRSHSVRRWRYPPSPRSRQRFWTAVIVAGLFVACALLGAFIF